MRPRGVEDFQVTSVILGETGEVGAGEGKNAGAGIGLEDARCPEQIPVRGLHIGAQDTLIFRGRAAGIEVVFVAVVGGGHVGGEQVGGDGIEVGRGHVHGAAREADIPRRSGRAGAVRTGDGEGDRIGAEA